jgi:hypothetical protein
MEAYTVLVLKSERKNHMEDLDVDGKIILKWISRIMWQSVDWIHMARVREPFFIIVNMVMNLQFP